MGEYYLGVRSNTHQVDALLRRVLARHLITDVDAPANFSIRLNPPDGNPSTGRRRSINVVYRSSATVLRARTAHRAVAGLVSHLSSFAAQPAGCLISEAAAIVGAGTAVLVPRELLGSLLLSQARLRRRGLAIVDAQVSAIDPLNGDLVVPPPALDVDPMALAALTDACENEQGVRPGRYPITGWVQPPSEKEYDKRSKAVMLAGAVQTITDPSRRQPETLSALAVLFERFSAEPPSYASIKDACLRAV